MAVPPAVECSRLGKRFGRSWALQDLEIEIPPGRMVALVGPNGAGKTTFLRLLVGFLRPTVGRVLVMGQDPAKQPKVVLREVGFLAQGAPLFRPWTVEDVLRFGRAMNQEWDRTLAVTRIRRFNIDLHQRVKRLSGGQRSQVALTLALAKRPRLLLLDEPLASLDPLARHEFLVELGEAASAAGFTVVLSSHDIAQLEEICDYLMLINGGHLQLAGNIASILSGHVLLPQEQSVSLQLPHGMEIVGTVHQHQQTMMVVRQLGVTGPIPGSQMQQVTLQQLVLAYLSSSSGGHSVE
jgi:ABC-2 type transport system ATP-binding protein